MYLLEFWRYKNNDSYRTVIQVISEGFVKTAVTVGYNQ